MARPITIPNVFQNQTGNVPLSQLDTDFSTLATAINDPASYSNYAVDSGIVNAYIITLNPAPSTLASMVGVTITFKPLVSNTGASTINMNSYSALNILNFDNSALYAGQIIAGNIVQLSYNGTNFILMGSSGRGASTVKDFGAVADWNGTTGTDNLVPFQNAYAAIKATGGTLLFPKGSYYCTSLIGSNPNDGADIANNVEFVGETGTNLIFSGTYAGGTCVGLQGNNVAIRNLNITSTRTLDYRAPLTPQRTPYQIGIYIGGKQNVSTLTSFYIGAQVTNCTITNMNLPIALYATGNALVQNCTIDMFTDTGIIVDNCTTDIWVLNNKVTRGGDDCFFARHYSTTAYATAGNFIGRFTVSGNIFHDTFGKNAGFGGIGDVIFSNNICSLNWAGGIALENTWGGQLNANNYQNVLIDGNTFWQPGQNFNTSYSSAAIQVPAPGYQPSGIHTVAAQDSTATYWYNNISITNNKIINPYYGAIALSIVKSVFISGNTFTAGSVNHGSGAVNTTGTCLTVDTASDILTTGNAVSNALGVDFTYCYGVATGTGPLANIRIEGNIDKFSTGAIAFSDGGAVTATKFNSYNYTSGGTQFNLVPYTYANLPATTAYTGSMVYCSNGRKVGEGGGAGTGVPVYFANAVWRVLSTDAAVAI